MTLLVGGCLSICGKSILSRYMWFHSILADAFTLDRHIMFGRDPVYCPDLAQCYKNVYNKGHFSFKTAKGG